MKNPVETLAVFEFFRGLPTEVLETLGHCAQLQDWPAHAYLAQEGDHAAYFYAIEQGRVSIELHRPGRGRHVIETLDQGQVAGWSWLFPPHRWSFDIRAMSPVRVLAFRGECLLKVCAERTDVGYILMRRLAYVIAQRLQATRVQLLDVYGNHFVSSGDDEKRLAT